MRISDWSADVCSSDLEAGGQTSQCRSRLRSAAAAGGLACTGMDRSVPTFRSLPLWPLPLLAALVPLLAAHLAWALSLRADLIPACNPYWDGCVSISRAARPGLGNHLFRLAMLPCAAVQVLCRLAAAHWLRRAVGLATCMATVFPVL